MRRQMILPFISMLLMIACGSSSVKYGKDPSISAVPVKLSGLSDKEKAYYAAAIEPLYQSLLLKRGFNGSILLAKNGEIVFEDYQGWINPKAKEDNITVNTAFHLASISKTFTATVILRLMEQGKLSLDDGVEKYLPSFPYHNITIKNLLSHRSGLPKYDHFMDADVRSETVWVKNRRGKLVKGLHFYKVPVNFSGFATNESVLQYMIDKKPPVESMPNRHFSYCNTNYAMLALIIEKVTGMSYPQYMKDSVFVPLGMKDSYVFSIRDTASYIPSYNYNNAPFKLEKLDCVYGDKNIYSTVRDLLQWDKSLYQGTLVSNQTLAMAYSPYSNEKRGQKNYGLGWHLFINPPDPTIVYHNGWWHGNNTVFKRLVSDSATVIILGNKFNRNIWAAGKMSSVFTGHADTTQLEH